MSCFVMEKHEIWYLAEAAHRYMEFYPLPNKLDLAKQLLQDNLNAVRIYYGSPPFPGPIPLPVIKEDDEPLSWSEEAFNPVQVIKAARCYLYQTGSLPEDNDSRQLMRQLMDAAIARLPGYEEAAWGGPPPIAEKKGGRNA